MADEFMEDLLLGEVDELNRENRNDMRKEKELEEEESKPKVVDLTLPGWGSWGGAGIAPKNRKRRKNQAKFPGVPRKDRNKKLVIINDEPLQKFKKLQVDDLPVEFPSVGAYEASIRAPVGDTWIPQIAHTALIAPPVVTKMGAIIQPIDESHLSQNKEDAELPIKTNKTPNKSSKFGSRKPGSKFKFKNGIDKKN